MTACEKRVSRGGRLCVCRTLGSRQSGRKMTIDECVIMYQWFLLSDYNAILEAEERKLFTEARTRTKTITERHRCSRTACVSPKTRIQRWWLDLRNGVGRNTETRPEQIRRTLWDDIAISVVLRMRVRTSKREACTASQIPQTMFIVVVAVATARPTTMKYGRRTNYPAADRPAPVNIARQSSVSRARDMGDRLPGIMGCIYSPWCPVYSQPAGYKTFRYQ